MTSRLLFVLALVLAGAVELSAQHTAPNPGERVRVTLSSADSRLLFTPPPPPLVGTVLGIERDTLRLRLTPGAGQAWLPLREVVGIEVSRGPVSRFEGMLRGLARGALQGFVLAPLVYLATRDSDRALEGGLIVVGVSAASGGVAGAIAPGERWQPLEPAGRPQPGS